MYGPCPPGHWSALVQPRNFGPLKVGLRYRVANAFVDHDRFAHEVGETWSFLGHNFLPYDDGLSLFVSLDGTREWQIRLQWRAEEQADIIDGLSKYIRPLPGQHAKLLWAALRHAETGL